MAEIIGVACAHGERVVPDNAEYSLFFELLRSQGRRTEALDEPLTPDRLAGVSALLLGEPHAELSTSEMEAVRSWVRGGGHLLLLSTMGGDAAPGAEEYGSRANLWELFPGMDHDDVVLGLDHGIHEGGPFDTKVSVDVSSLVGRRATLCYDSGTLLLVDDDEIRRASPAVTGPVRALAAPPDVSALIVRLHEAGRSHRMIGAPYPAEGLLTAAFGAGAGEVTCFGASWSFKDDTIIREDNLLFADWLLHQWLPRLTEQELQRRMRSPQRHRLLHGYPMAPLLHTFAPGETGELARLTVGIAPAPDRPLLVGVLPHPFCNPRVKGCGFCTFPHEVFQREAAGAVTSSVAHEVAVTTTTYPELHGREVAAMYIGGGTANLTPAAELGDLCRTLADSFALDGAEVTLEGVPIYFLTGGLLPILAERLGTSRLRVSMGIQTFAPTQLRRMGRAAFGDEKTVASVVEMAHREGYSASGDLLFNLPGQTRAEMADDVDRAMGLGLDQICLYHLVLFDGLGTEWSRDPDLLGSLPSNPEACETFLGLRDRLLAGGYRQRSLTNFELASHAGTPREFLYEQAVFCPESYDWLGFGPAAISMVSDAGFQWALKLQNPEQAREYTTAMLADQPPWQKYFAFSAHDMKILYVTRKIAALGFRRDAYRALFGSDVAGDFPRETDALVAAGLVELDASRWALTPRGMFHADSVAGLLASRQVGHLRMLERAQGRIPAAERRYYGVEQRSWMG